MKISPRFCNSSTEAFPPTILSELNDALASVSVTPRRRAAPLIRARIIEQLHKKGWSDQVGLHATSKISITSLKARVGLCLQVGNVSRVYADLAKLQTMYKWGSIDWGVIVLPSAAMSRELGQNVANSDRLLREMEVFREVFTLPLLVAGFNKEAQDYEQ